MKDPLDDWKHELQKAKQKYQISEEDYQAVKIAMLQGLYRSHLQGVSKCLEQNKELIKDLKKEVEKWQIKTSQTESPLWKMISRISKPLSTKLRSFLKSRPKTL